MDSPDATLHAAGINSDSNGAQPRLKRVRGFNCEVCYDDQASGGETLALSCDHRCELALFLSVEREGEGGGEMEG